MKPTQLPAEMTIEELLAGRDIFIQAKEEYEAAISVYQEEIMNRLKAENLSGKVVGNKAISRITRTNFDVTLDQARDFGAVLTKEVVDNDMLRALLNKGVKIPTKLTEYITIKEIQNDRE